MTATPGEHDNSISSPQNYRGGHHLESKQINKVMNKVMIYKSLHV